MSSSLRQEYLARIHRAQDFIESRLAEPLTLESIAEAACFSPFHFHRVFSSVVGETLYQYILRLRLERAACQLLQDPNKPVTVVAMECGFSSSATFARAFRGHYGINATEWRLGGGEDFLDPSMRGQPDRDRKNCKTLRKDRKAGMDGPLYGEGTAAEENPILIPVADRSYPMSVPAQSISVESLDAFTVAYVRHVGPYAGDLALFGRLFGQLMAWAGPRDMLKPDTKMLTIYHDNPELTEADKLRISACMSVPSGTKTEGEIGLMDIPAGKCIVAQFSLDVHEYAGAWQYVMADWLPQSGYQPDNRPCYELMLNDPCNHPDAKHLVQIVMPVKPL